MKNFFQSITHSIIIIVTALYFAITGLLNFYPNFHTVLPNKIYRSAQLNTAQFKYYIHKYHIKSILNLRGQASTRRWYQNEINTVQSTQVRHYDFGLAPKGSISIKNMQTLAHIIRNAPKPLLIHCWHGADRTGLGSAVALLLLTQEPLAKIKRQVSWRYGVVSPNSVGVVELSYYQHWLQQHELTSSAKSFLHWLEQLQRNQNYLHRT